MEEERPKRMALIASQGTLDWAYPPFILASTAVAMEMQVAVFFTFYGLTLLKRKITAKVAPHANPSMPMKMSMWLTALTTASKSLLKMANTSASLESMVVR